MPAQPLPKRPCTTCTQLRAAEDFYANCSECKTCKRNRSKRNRALQARKLAAFERFVDALISLADNEADGPLPKAKKSAA